MDELVLVELKKMNLKLEELHHDTHLELRAIKVRLQEIKV